MYFNKANKLVLIHVLLLLCFSKSYSQVNMFRGTPEHVSSIRSKSDFIFGDEAWKFDADAPIRSTVVYGGGSVFFGASNGTFYALDKTTGKTKWKYNTGFAINSSPAFNKGVVFFADNKQALYALDANTGRQIWKFDFGTNLNYEWGFDYFYSSPTIVNDKIFIGAKDGFVYNVNSSTGKVIWKFKPVGIVRSTPAVSGHVVFFGDTDGILYAIDLFNGKELWRFLSAGNGFKNEDFGFDRRALISSAVVKNDKVIVGGRDGFLYAINKNNGKELWRMNHEVSWVISSVAVEDSFVVTGTSDGRFVQAINLNTGKEIWKYKTVSIVWSSPVIHNKKVYIGSQEGVLYCFQLQTGQRLNNFQGSGKIFTSPVISDSLLFFGTDNGYLYALRPARYTYPQLNTIKRFVFWEPGINNYFRLGNDVRIRDYLSGNGYMLIDSKRLVEWMNKKDSAEKSVIVFASNYFPGKITDGYEKSLLRNYLNNGGKIVTLGMNPLIFKTDPVTKAVLGRNLLFPDSVLNINYGPDDLRSVRGLQPAFPTEEGKSWGLRKSWTGFLSLPAGRVDIILGKDENGLASAWVKKYSKAPGSGFVQIWVDSDGVDDPGYIMRVAEHGF